MTPDERDLIAKIRAGDPKGYRQLYNRYASRVMGFALRLTYNRSDAEDLVQDVFIAAYKGYKSYRGKGSLISWLLGIAWRCWRDHSRNRHELSPKVAEFDQDLFASSYYNMEVNIIAEVTLNRALQQLDLPLRETLLLVGSQGLSYKEAAAIMDVPVGTVKSRVSRANHEMARLLHAIEEEFHEMQQHTGTAS